MGANCGCHNTQFDGMDGRYKRALIAVILINAIMFFVEMPLGFVGHSQAMKADALDFLGDTITYAMSLAVIGHHLHVRSKAALIKGISLLLMGLWVLGSTIYAVFVLHTPAAGIMGTVGATALAANLTSVFLLMRYKDGDANVRSVWLCSRNDAIGNLMVMLAASGVWATKTGWPDLIIAFVMASLFVYGAFSIIRQARAELKHQNHHHAAAE
ncbi:cation transporter [Kordiimonas marina]|uniref:cation transporter n=1 Tax=Kordiimonas marina TaxID=2872312 RepID=UPI001FF3D520|nr:cation transporter [Kordiimonas marina]MCJ9428376.1 cation transporter [Kordiimonas marina]